MSLNHDKDGPAGRDDWYRLVDDDLVGDGLSDEENDATPRDSNDDDDDEEKKKKKKKCCGGRLTRCQAWSLGVLLFLTVATVLGVTVVGRAVATRMMNNAKVTLDEVHLRDPEDLSPCGGHPMPAGGNRTLCVRVVGSVARTVPVRASVSAARVEVSVPGPGGGRVGTFRMPRQEFASGSRPRINVTTVFEVDDVALFAQYNAALVSATGEVPWKARASLHLTAHLWSFVTLGWRGLPYHKEVGMPGLGGMRNLTVDSYELPRNAPGGGVELLANATVWSGGKYFVTMGECEFLVYYRNSTGLLGRVTVERTRLRPGANRVTVRGVLRPDARADRVLEPFFSAYAARRPGLEIIVRGAGVGRGMPEWAGALVRDLDLRVPVVSTLDLDVVRSIDVHSVNCTFDREGNPVVGANVSSAFASPFGFPLRVLEVAMNVTLLHGGAAIGGMRIPPVAVGSRMGQQNVSVAFGRQQRLDVGDRDGFDALVRSVLADPSVRVQARANVSVRFLSGLGDVWVRGIPLPRPLSIVLRGFDSFRGVSVSNGALYSANGTEDALTVTSAVSIGNPTPVSADVGPMLVNITYDAERLGTVVIGTAFLPDARIGRGVSAGLVATASLIPGAEPNAGPAIDEFISRYIRQDAGISVGMRGRPDSTRIPLLQPVLATTRLDLHFQVPRYQFIRSVDVTVSLFHGIKAHVTVFNPLPVPATVTHMSIPTYDKDGREIYVMERTNQLTVQAGVHEVDVSVPLTGIKWDVLWDAFKVWKTHEITVGLGGQIGFLVPPAFQRTVDYSATGVVAHVSF